LGNAGFLSLGGGDIGLTLGILRGRGGGGGVWREVRGVTVWLRTGRRWGGVCAWSGGGGRGRPFIGFDESGVVGRSDDDDMEKDRVFFGGRVGVHTLGSNDGLSSRVSVPFFPSSESDDGVWPNSGVCKRQ